MCRRVSRAQAAADAARVQAQKAEAEKVAAQAKLFKEQERIAAIRDEVRSRRARVDELHTTYVAKQQMVTKAQLQWSKRSASCATQVALGQPSQQFEEGPGFGASLRRAMGEVKCIPRSTPPTNRTASLLIQCIHLTCCE
jgi:hypothetical protein